MSKVGEATGGFGRFFGGIPRTKLPNEVGSVPIALVGTAAWGVRHCVNIDAIGEGCTGGFYIPSQWSRVRQLIFWFKPLNTTGLINVTIMASGERRAVASGTIVGFNTDIQVTLNMVTNLVVGFVVDLAPYTDIRAGDFVEFEVAYDAAGGGGAATDLMFIGCTATEA